MDSSYVMDGPESEVKPEIKPKVRPKSDFDYPDSIPECTRKMLDALTLSRT